MMKYVNNPTHMHFLNAPGGVSIVPTKQTSSIKIIEHQQVNRPGPFCENSKNVIKNIQRHRPCGAEYSSMPPKQMRQQSAAEAADLEVT